MKKLLKHMGCLAISGTILVAAACGNGAGAVGAADSTAVPTEQAGAGGADGVVAPMNTAADTVANNINTASTSGTQADVAFVNDALAANTAEIAAHKAAISKAENKDVRMHAQHMLTDHSRMGDDLKAYARKKAYTVSSDVPADKQAALEALNSNSKGSAWDKAYVAQQVRDHQEVIARFEAAQNAVVDPELKSMIASALPKLRTHLQMMQEVQGKL